jgi:hypothetical protein
MIMLGRSSTAPLSIDTTQKIRLKTKSVASQFSNKWRLRKAIVALFLNRPNAAKITPEMLLFPS